MSSKSEKPDREPKYKIGDIVVRVSGREEFLRIIKQPEWTFAAAGFMTPNTYHWFYETTMEFAFYNSIHVVKNENLTSEFEPYLRPFTNHIDSEMEVLEKRRELLLKAYDDCYKIQNKK
jgi:hypothetical protein